MEGETGPEGGGGGWEGGRKWLRPLNLKLLHILKRNLVYVQKNIR